MLVIGVDGANVDTLIAPARRGSLPNLQDLLDDGVGGTLRSRTTSSAAAWTAHLTGVSPEESGITGFTKDGRFVETGDIRVLTYPELLDRSGVRVGLLNIPLTYPPLELDHGFCVPGQLTPLSRDVFAHPPELHEILDSLQYEVDIQYGDRQYAFVDDELDVDREQILADVKQVEGKRLQAARRLIAEEEWDLFFVLVNGTDPLQHYFWHEIVGSSLEKTSMFPVYRLIDGFVGDVRTEYPDENVLLFSDHGFREDVWGTDEATRARWGKIRRLGSRLMPTALKQTRVRQWAMDGLAAGAKATTTMDPAENMHTGSHDPAGVWLLGGPDVDTPAGLVETEFLDIPATLLHLMGQPVPTRYEGRVRTDFLVDECQPKSTDIDINCARTHSDTERKMKEQLAHLGYVEMVEEDT